jgi:hypothetical protein
MLLSAHANWGSALALTAEHQRRQPRMAGGRAGKHNRQFIGALVEDVGLGGRVFDGLVNQTRV